MIVECITVGPLMENAYLLGDKKTKESAIIDPGDEAKKIIGTLEKHSLKCKYILLTHAHVDHVAGVKELAAVTGADVLMHKADSLLLKAAPIQAVAFGIRPFIAPRIAKYIEDGEIIQVGNISVRVIHTPGHSPGSVCFLAENVIFAGDTLFQSSIGRTDIPGGDYEALIEGVRKKIFTLPDDTEVLPGHGPATSVGFEKENNPFF